MPQEKTPAPTDAKAEKTPKAVTRKIKQQNAYVSKLAVFSTFLSLVLIAVIGSAGWYGYKNIWPLLSNDTLAGQNWVDQQLSQNSRTVQQVMDKTRSAVQEDVKSVSGQSDRLVVRIDNLDRRFNRLQGADRSDWKLAEAEYLMRLANQRLLTMHDIRSAKTLLSQADELLVAVDEYGLFTVRQALAEDLAALRATPNIDISASWMELNALANRIDVLPLASDIPVIDTAINTESSTESPAQTQESLPADATLKQKITYTLTGWFDTGFAAAKDIGATFATQFRLRDNNQKVAPLLAPEQEVYLRQNLRLMLEQAQVALLQGRTVVYQASLAKTKSWLDEWFLNESVEMKALDEALTRLAGTPVEQQIPEISRSLIALKTYIDEKADQRLPVESVSKETAGDRS
ncbi:uroporphyrinogen-III C-methyltransferase [Parendozoicomonas sp. Alg238-R29]|uniref:uroporphyrinogen-III C-methyltransferase n=1 Tax=Parendozoicomonas sp. Alg238-R29 TaxID=2993446 RepID=UPI00248DE281|nr:uroporphyrinogen-III C-methyltransferase [Parendozoicomonas sp. Alg238-R29]